MIASIKRFFGIVETDLGKILKVFNTAKADLEAHISLHKLAADAKEAEAAAAQEAAKLLHTAAAEAETVLNKLKALVG